MKDEAEKFVDELLGEISEGTDESIVEHVSETDVFNVVDNYVDKKEVEQRLTLDIEKIEKNELVNIVRSKGFCQETVNKLKEELIEEIAFLKDLRNERVDEEDVNQIVKITEKRTKILKDLLDVIAKEESIRSNRDKRKEKIDFYGEGFQRVFKHLLKIVQDTFLKVKIPIQYVDIYFSELAKALDNFEKEAEKLYYETDKKNVSDNKI